MPDVVLCVASTVASIVAGCLVAPVGRLCGHVTYYDSHVHELEDKVAELGSESKDMQESIGDAQNNMRPIKDRVNQWMENVEKHTDEARRVLDDYGKSKKTCFYGWLPNPKVRYRLSREARSKAKRIQRFINQKPKGNVYDNRLPGLVDGAPVISSAGDRVAGDRGDAILDSRTSILESIMNALGDQKVKVIGIYGPAGVGKTTLLEKVEEKLRTERRLFHMIVKSEVSRTPDLSKIQDDIAYAFGLDLRDVPSEVGRRDRLVSRLQWNPNEKVLIILDNLWEAFDLRAVGIPLGDESGKCKFLLTSRDKSVLEVRLHAEQTFHLERLSLSEAFRVLVEAVGDQLKGDEELIRKVVAELRKLAGLPLYINTAASLLKSEDVSTWENMLIKLEDQNIENGE